MVTWHLPKLDQLALDVDGSSYGNPGRAGYGGVIRDHQGKWILGFSGHVEYADSLHVELLAIFIGLSVAWDVIEAKNLTCRSDCMQALSLIQDPTPRPLIYSGIIDDIKELLSRDWLVSLTHTYREGNQCADYMAKFGANFMDCTKTFSEPPSCLHSLLKSDATGIQYTRPVRVFSM